MSEVPPEVVSQLLRATVLLPRAYGALALYRKPALGQRRRPRVGEPPFAVGQPGGEPLFRLESGGEVEMRGQIAEQDRVIRRIALRPIAPEPPARLAVVESTLSRRPDDGRGPVVTGFGRTLARLMIPLVAHPTTAPYATTTVAAGDTLVVISAMKMEQAITASGCNRTWVAGIE